VATRRVHQRQRRSDQVRRRTGSRTSGSARTLERIQAHGRSGPRAIWQRMRAVPNPTTEQSLEVEGRRKQSCPVQLCRRRHNDEGARSAETQIRLSAGKSSRGAKRAAGKVVSVRRSPVVERRTGTSAACDSGNVANLVWLQDATSLEARLRTNRRGGEKPRGRQALTGDTVGREETATSLRNASAVV
jgi:hypothetical protein